ncbi:hypothetical protein JKF63_05200 [Porcisia hertigi]|uniref:Adenylate kinase n=1 Tax=Porcisia hertigi TaxID=2761500 RepID=A0A836LFN1_9TRYP|nr:hypothetical protein JKF63_05200 [Porcisia hertigi]
MSTGSVSDATLEYFNSKGIQSILEEAMHNLVLEMPEDPLTFLDEVFRRPTPVRVILTGPRGSGKTTLAAKLAAHYGVAHVLASAATVDDVAMPGDVLEELKSLQRKGKGWVLDGLPQTRAEVIQLQTLGVSPQHVFELQVPLGVVLERFTATATGTSSQLESLEAIAKSQKLYNVRRIEIVTSYQRCYHAIDATPPAEQVTADVIRAIDTLQRS